VWTTGGISAESIAAGGGVVLASGTQRGESPKRLIALDASTGRQVWVSSFTPERVVAAGNQTALVLIPVDGAPRLRWIELASGRELDIPGCPRFWGIWFTSAEGPTARLVAAPSYWRSRD
jgi:hypothetical protein